MYLFKILPFISQYGESKNAIKGKTLNSTSINNMLVPLPPLAEQKRIVAKIEELLPLVDRYAEAWNRLEALDKRFPDDLKKSLLQLAIQGKLVPQLPDEGTGEELYRKIQSEKKTLIKAGKIKKEKPLPEISDDEKPFDIPESWRWVRLGEISTYSHTKEKISANQITNSMWCLDLEDIEKDTGKILNICLASERKIAGDKVKFYKGQILYSKLRPYLKKILTATGDGICSSEIVPFSTYGNIDSDFMVNYLKSPYVDFTINSVTYGVKMPRVGTDTMINLLVPLPPIAEQKRIVAKIEELLPLVERYAEAWNRLEALNKRFPDDLKKSLLQLAIQGKLVPQLPDEGTGEELYRKIQSEKQALIKAGKIKKEKPLPEISDDEKPFDIPKSWRWVRWGDLSDSIQYGYNAPAQSSGNIKMVRISDIQDGKVMWDTVPYCTIPEAEIQNYLLQKNAILFARTGGTVGKSYLVDDITDDAIYAGYLIRTQYSNLLSPKYMKYFMESNLYWVQLRDGTIATAQPNCNGKTLAKMMLPLPPLSEQKRIVAKLEEILPLCERLK